MKTQTKLLSIAAAVAITGATLGQVFAASPDDQHEGLGQQAMRGSGTHGMSGSGSMEGMGNSMMHMGQAMMHMGRSMMNQAHGSRMGGTFGPQKVETLKQQLGITEDQEEDWDTYAKVLKDVIETKRSRHEGVDRTAMRNMSDEDRQAFRAAMQKKGQETHATLKTAATALLESLNDDQKTKAQGTLPGLAAFGPGEMQQRGMRGKRGKRGTYGMHGYGAGKHTGPVN